MSADLAQIWVYLAATPLMGLTATLGAYAIGLWLFERLGRHALVNPVLVSVAMITTLLLATGTSYHTYFDGAQFVHFLLGPATVALAVPLYRQWAVLKRAWPAVLAALGVGAMTAALSAVALARLLGGSDVVVRSLAPKSVTTPIAMGIAERIGGLPSLTAVLVVITGVVGAVIGGWVLDRAGVREPAARGLALGVASHGIGTVRAMQEGETQGAFAALAIGLTGLISAIALPLLAGWLF
jgi:predicted murein hydrolase (TIGR00659 family)